jgi:heptaprenyl diphosphate synthase
MSSFAYSISGGILSFLAMYGVMKLLGDSISEVSVSIIGAIFHNIGQLLMASIILSNIKMIYYLPFLMLSAVATGLIVGLTGKILIKYLKKIVALNGNY